MLKDERYIIYLPMKAILLVVLLVALVNADPKVPVWADHWQQQFVESYLDSTFKTIGYIWYDATRKSSRIKRENGRLDAFCGSVTQESTACERLYRDGK